MSTLSTAGSSTAVSPVKRPLITSTYEHELQAIFWEIEKRGLAFDTAKLSILRDEVLAETEKLLQTLSQSWGVDVYLGAKDKLASKKIKRVKGALNIGGTQQLLTFLKKKGYKIPKIPASKEQRDRGDGGHRESVNELSLRRIFAESGSDDIKNILSVRENATALSKYVNARLSPEGVYYSNYDVAGTKTGRRGCSEIIFGWGGNAQNFPKHSTLGKKFHECVIPRSGHIFLNVDQKGAEEWPVNALARNESALAEQRAGINRHRKLAAFLFSLREEDISKESMEYFLGKKTRHANNYGMMPQRMSDSLATEGYSVPTGVCATLLQRVNQYDPSIKKVFHKYVQEQIDTTRMLRTPLGRERTFFGFRPSSMDYNLWNECYAWIPQSFVGDNTGLALTALHSFITPSGGRASDGVVNEKHDSILFEVLFSKQKLIEHLQYCIDAFDRDIMFDNGISINIPIEAEIGFDLSHMISLRDMSVSSLEKALAEVEALQIQKV